MTLRRAVAAVLTVLAFASLAAQPAQAFTDVPSDHPHASAIADLSARGIVSGFADGSFGPAQTVKRQQFAKMIVLTLALDVDESDVCDFPDVSKPSDDLYPDNYVAVAADAKITQGYADGEFKPFRDISRAQVVTMVVRAAENLLPKGLAVPTQDATSAWGPALGGEHGANAGVAQYNGLLWGLGRDATHPDGDLSALDPWAPMPRGEVAQVLRNLILILHREPAGMKMSAADTAAALGDPATVESGVWSILANLGIGVYSPQALQVMGGSERSNQDLFLFSFEVPVLAGAALEAPIPFSDFHDSFAAMGMDITEDDLLAEYRRIYLDDGSDEWLSQLFQKMGLEFDENTVLTPLQSWLLMLDALVPANGSVAPAALRSSGEDGSAIRGLAEEPCSSIRGPDVDPAYGVVWKVGGILSDVIETAREGAKVGSGGLSSLLDPVDAIHAFLIWLGTDLYIVPDPMTAHERHPGQPASPVSFTLYADFDPGNLPEFWSSCAAVLGFDIPAAGPVSDLGVEWSIDSVLAQHGTSNLGGATRVTTDGQGRSEIEWVPRVEPSKGEGDEHTRPGVVTAKVQVQHGDVLNFWAGLQEMLLPRSIEKSVSVGWHEKAWKFHMTLTMGDGVTSEWTITWDGLFIVDDENNIDGEGTGTIFGFGHMTDSEGHVGPDLYVNGSFLFDISGTQEGQEFRLRADGRNAQTNVTGYDPKYGTVFMELLAEGVRNLAVDPMQITPFGWLPIKAQDGKTTSWGSLTLTITAADTGS